VAFYTPQSQIRNPHLEWANFFTEDMFGGYINLRARG